MPGVYSCNQLTNMQGSDGGGGVYRAILSLYMRGCYSSFHYGLVCPGSVLEGAEIEVMLAKPVDKDCYPRGGTKMNRMTTVPAKGFIPVDGYGTMVPASYPSSYSISPKSVPLHRAYI